MPVARKGAETAEQSAKSGGAGRVEFFRMKDGDPPAYIRPIDDHRDWINADVHPAIPTKPAPKNYTGTKWPSLMSATCQNDAMFLLYGDNGEPLVPEQYETGMGECWIHANLADQLDRFNKPKSNSVPMVFALCVLREPVLDPTTKAIVALRDVMEEWADPKGNKRKVPAFRVISQRWGNFFSAMKAGAFLDDTVTNKDWRISRSGNDYTIVPLPPTADHSPGTPSWAAYTEAIDLMKIDIFATIAEQGSVKYYQRFFIPGDFGDDDGGEAVASTDPEAGADVDPDKLAAFAERLRNSAESSS